MKDKIINYIEQVYSHFYDKIEIIWPKLLSWLVIIILWFFIARWIYFWVLYLFKRFDINALLKRLEKEFIQDDEEEITEESHRSTLVDRVNVDKIVWRACAYYVFILFFRLAVQAIWITAVEDFLSELIAYLPSLFIGFMIWFFWVRFSNFVYDVVYHALTIAKEQTAKLMAVGAKVVVLFFTFLAFLKYIKIVDDFIIYTALVGFISMISLAWWLAFGIWGKDMAKEILEKLKK